MSGWDDIRVYETRLGPRRDLSSSYDWQQYVLQMRTASPIELLNNFNIAQGFYKYPRHDMTVQVVKH